MGNISSFVGEDGVSAEPILLIGHPRPVVLLWPNPVSGTLNPTFLKIFPADFDDIKTVNGP